jgi:pimeloyl-ACP methyl ester carboxylesterase
MATISSFRSEEARAAYLQLYDAVLAASTIPVTELDVNTSFGCTHVLQAGDASKPPIVALHGQSISSTMWVPLLPTLAAAHSVTMVDTVGEPGKSTATKPTTNSAELVAWLDETLRAVGIQRSAVVAVSRGTWIATHYTMAFPERVDRLALVCPVGIVSGMRPTRLVRALTTVAVWPTEPRLWSFLDIMVQPTKRETLRQEPWLPIMEQFVSGTMTFKTALSNARPKRCDLQPLLSGQVPVLAIIGRDDFFQNGPKRDVDGADRPLGLRRA